MLERSSDDPAFDPKNLLTSEMFDKLSEFEKYKIRKAAREFYPDPSIKIKADFYSGEELVTGNEVNYILPFDEQYYSGRQDFLLNSYTVRKDIDSIEVTFPVSGIYHFDEFSLVLEPMTGYADSLGKLSAESLENVQIKQNKSSYVSCGVLGEITVTDNKLLCLTVPYSTGWRAYVDGSPAVLENVNLMFTGLWLTPGHHTIELRYETPGLLYGICISAGGLLLFLLWLILSHRAGKSRVDDDSVSTEEAIAEDAAEPFSEAPAQDSAEPSVEAPAEDSVEPSDETPAEDSVEPSDETPAQDSVEPSDETPAQEDVPEPGNLPDEGGSASEEDKNS